MTWAQRRLGDGVDQDRDRRLRGGHAAAAGGSRSGRAGYPQADRLLVGADGGGSNGYRARAWKTELARPQPRPG